MIELITGTPGAGKTLYAVSSVKARAEKEGRPVFYSGITILDRDALPWTEIDPEKWYEAPAGAIIVIDECQRVYRPRGNGSAVPRYISELETHRHKGLDLVLLTQHPMLVDSNIRRLVGLHRHVARRFGLQRSSVFEFESCKDQPLSKIDAATARLEWTYPKEAFTWYKSAEVHTVKRRIPRKFFLLAAMVALVGAGVVWEINSWNKKLHGDFGGDVKAAGLPDAATSTRPLREAPDPYQYFKDRVPRLVGVPASAAVYDKVTEPTTAPVPVACAASKSRCRCFSQQATALDVPDDLCRKIVAGGFFEDWRRPETVPTESKLESKGPASPVLGNP